MKNDYDISGKWVLVYGGGTWVVCAQESGWIGTEETIEIVDTESECETRVSELELTPRFPFVEHDIHEVRE